MWRVVVLLLVVATGSAGCDGVSPYTVVGEQAAVADGQAFTWANINSDSQVRELGLTIPLQVLPALQDGFSLTLALPVEVQNVTPLRCVMLELRQQRAFLPALYQVPRLDVRFFSASRGDLELVDCRRRRTRRLTEANSTLDIGKYSSTPMWFDER